MRYITRQMIEMQMRASALLEALDDSGSHQETDGALEGIVAAAEQLVDGEIGPANAARVAALVDAGAEIPSLVSSSALAIACYMIARRQTVDDEKNPYRADKDAALRRCQAVGKGDATLFPSSASAQAASGCHNHQGAITAAPLKFSERNQEGI